MFLRHYVLFSLILHSVWRRDRQGRQQVYRHTGLCVYVCTIRADSTSLSFISLSLCRVSAYVHTHTEERCLNYMSLRGLCLRSDYYRPWRSLLCLGLICAVTTKTNEDISTSTNPTPEPSGKIVVIFTLIFT